MRRRSEDWNLWLQDMHTELQDVMGQSFGVPDDIDEDDLMGELDALEDELAQEAENPTANGVPSYLQVRHSYIVALSLSTVGTTVGLHSLLAAWAVACGMQQVGQVLLRPEM